MHPTPSPLCWQSEVSDLHPGVKASIAHLIFIVSCLCGKRDNGSKPSDGGGCGGEGHGAWSRLFIETLVDWSCCNQVAVVLLDCSSANKKSCPSSNPRWPCLGFWGEIESLLSTYLSSEAIYVWFGLIWFQLGIQGDESQCEMSYLSRSQSVRKEVKKKKEFLEQYASCLHVVLKNTTCKHATFSLHGIHTKTNFFLSNNPWMTVMANYSFDIDFDVNFCLVCFLLTKSDSPLATAKFWRIWSHSMKQNWELLLRLQCQAWDWYLQKNLQARQKKECFGERLFQKKRGVRW